MQDSLFVMLAADDFSMSNLSDSGKHAARSHDDASGASRVVEQLERMGKLKCSAFAKRELNQSSVVSVRMTLSKMLHGICHAQ